MAPSATSTTHDEIAPTVELRMYRPYALIADEADPVDLSAWRIWQSWVGLPRSWFCLVGELLELVRPCGGALQGLLLRNLHLAGHSGGCASKSLR